MKHATALHGYYASELSPANETTENPNLASAPPKNCTGQDGDSARVVRKVNSIDLAYCVASDLCGEGCKLRNWKSSFGLCAARYSITSYLDI